MNIFANKFSCLLHIVCNIFHININNEFMGNLHCTNFINSCFSILYHVLLYILVMISLCFVVKMYCELNVFRFISVGSSDAAALAVAQHALGVGPSVKYGSNATSALGKAVAGSGGIGMASAVNINYSDSGLFGYFVVADSGSADKVSFFFIKVLF